MISRLNNRAVLAAAFLAGLVMAGCDQSASSSQANSEPATTTVAQRTPQQQPQQPSQTAPKPAGGHDHSRGGTPTAPVLGQPPIEFDPPELDLGIVRPNQRVTGTIYIQNISDKQLKIVSSKADCTCTSVDLANTMLAPGERIPMRADYNSSTAMGEKRSAVRVLVEGYDMAEVSIKAFVTMPVRAVPAFITAVPNGEEPAPTKGEFLVDSLNKQPFRILAVNGKAPEYADYDPASAEVRNSYTLKWDFSGFDPKTCTDAQGNRIPGWLVIETDHPECPVFDMEIRHDCNRRPRRQPTETWYVPEKRVLIGEMRDGRPEEFDVIVKWYGRVRMDDPPATVLSESPLMKAELVSSQRQPDGVICKVKVTPAPGHRGLISGNIRLHAKNQSAPLIVVGSVTE